MRDNKTVSFSKSSTNIFFHILTDCNLHCRHCYINKKQHGENTLPVETINAWLDAFAGKSDVANVIFLGGEPTLHPDLFLAVKHAKKTGYKSVTIDTNGYLFNDILSKIEPGEVDCISFSLDGATRRTNDMLRGKGSYDKCILGIKEAVSKGFNTSLIYTVSSANIDELDMIEGLLCDLGVGRFFVQVIGIRGRTAKSGSPGGYPENLQISRLKWLDKIPKAAEKIARHGITVTYPEVFLNPEERFECAGLVADNYFIFPNGRVYRCPLCEDYPIHSMEFEGNMLVKTGKINETDMFGLSIPEGCVMNRLIQPGNLSYKKDGTPEYKIACCLLKEEIAAGR
ncbi:MAG: heme biosynthesis protein [Desulfobacteraceae bacterium A6]|nr:MAG: heme biosynthesis protein [Desulfobacteraceae bacterium A6]